MRVVLEIRSGIDAGRSVLLRRGEELRVGRSEWADLACRDEKMSRVHFKIYADRLACYVEDLQSSNGTLVNDTPVGNAVLRNGDIISAGQTQFQVRIEGDRPDEAAVRQTVMQDPALALLNAVKAAKSQYTAEPCETGITLYRGLGEQVTPAQVAQMLTRVYSLYLLVDARKLAVPPENKLPGEPLFNWLPPAAAAASPVVVAAKEFEEWPALMAQNWGEDALVCLFSPWGKDQLLSHLRSLAQGGDDRRGVLGYCWPSVLSPMLSFYRGGFVESFYEGVTAALVELPDLPDTWQIFADVQFSQTLDQLGFQRQPDEKSPPDASQKT
jgi:pSer/pThr/pTyr-binding forkhead associated (FHA) protein